MCFDACLSSLLQLRLVSRKTKRLDEPTMDRSFDHVD